MRLVAAVVVEPKQQRKGEREIETAGSTKHEQQQQKQEEGEEH